MTILKDNETHVTHLKILFRSMKQIKSRRTMKNKRAKKHQN